MDKTKNNRNMLAHFVAIGSGTIINMLLGLIATPIITRLVDPVEYGKLSIFETYTSIALMVLCVGLDQALVRFFYEKDTLTYKQALLKFCFLLPLIISSVAAVGVIVIKLCFGILPDFDLVIVVFLCVNVMATIWNRISMMLLRLTYQSKKYATCNVIHRAAYLIIALLLIFLIDDHDILMLVIATVLAWIIAAASATFFTKKFWKFGDAEKLTTKKEILKYGYPLIFSMGITAIFQACDKLAIETYCDYADVGVYASAVTLVSVFAIVQTTFNAMWAPILVEQLTKDPENKSMSQKANKYITIVMFTIGICLIFAKDLFALLLGEKYREAAYILPFLAFNPIMYTISETTHPGITLVKKSGYGVLIAAVSCVANIIGNAILVPVLGPRGAAISTGISYVIFFFMRTLISNKFYYVDFKLWKISIMIAVTAVQAYFNTFYGFGWISVITFLVSLATLVLLYFKDIVELIKLAIVQVKGLLGKKDTQESNLKEDEK